MGMVKKGEDALKKLILPKQFQNLILPNLQEATFRADTIKIPDFEASGVEVTCKFQPPNPQFVKTKQVKIENSFLDKLWLFVLKQTFSTFCQFFIIHYSRFLP
jgi:hypothetical protein